MKIDFDYINRVAAKLHEAFVEDGGMEAYSEGRHVYSLRIEPETKRVEIHVQWPMFRNLVANEADAPATCNKISSVENMDPWMHWHCDVQGVHLTACVNKWDVIQDLKELVSEHPESDYEICEDDDIENLFNIWQNMTGWNLGWEVTTNG